MAVNEIKVNTTRLKNDAEKISQLIRKMDADLDAMISSVNQLNQMWEGPSKNAFVAAFNDDQKAAEQVLKELQSLYKYEAQAKNKYEQCERQIASVVASIRV